MPLLEAWDAYSRHASDPKCKLEFSSFLTLPYPLDCLIFAKVIMINVLLLQINGDGKVGVGSLMLGFGWRGKTRASYFLFLVQSLCLFFHEFKNFKIIVLCISLLIFLLPLSLVPLIRRY